MEAAVEGLLIYQTDNTPGFYYFNGTAWTTMGGDNLGNHTATQNIQTVGNWISNDGDNEGVSISADGNVGIGINAPVNNLQLHEPSAFENYLHFSNTDTGSAATDGLILGLLSNETAAIWNRENTPLAFATNNSVRMSLDETGRLGIGSSPISGALLSLNSSNQGFLMSRMTEAQRNAITSPPEALQIYQTDNSPGFYYYNGTAWTSLGADNLGNHTATQNLQTAGNWISNDGNNEGITVNTVGDVGIGTATPSSGAILDITATDGGLLIPRMTQVQRDAIGSPATGLLVYQTNNTPGFYYYNGTAWTNLSIDNLGNHTATQNVQLGTNWLSGDGGNEGLTISATGDIGMGIASPINNLHLHEPSASFNYMLFSNTDTGTTTTDGYVLGTLISEEAVVWNRENTSLLLATNNLERMRITNSGVVGIGTTAPATGAKVDISATDGGLLIPRVTQTQRDAITTPTTGVLVFQTDNTPGFYYYNGAAWTGMGDDHLGNHTATQNIQTAGNWISNDGGNEGIAITATGEVGLGINAPGDNLQIHETTASSNFITFTDASTGATAGSDGTVVGILNDDLYLWNRENNHLRFGTSNLERMVLTNTGNLGIGTASPNARLHIASASGSHTGNGRFFDDATTPVSLFGNATRTHAIWASGHIATDAGFLAYSDKRIKKDISTRSTTNDLNLINQINVVNYNYTDYRAHGTRNNIGFIAQQVQKVMPDAVTAQKEFIPNIYNLSDKVIMANNETIITLSKSYDVKTGDKLKVIVPNVGEKIVDIINVKNNKIITTPLEEQTDKVFVYGKQVDDFLAVEYDDVFTVSISAIQELSKQIEALKKENKMLKEQFAQMNNDNSNTIKSELTVLKEELAALKASLNSSNQNTITQVSTK